MHADEIYQTDYLKHCHHDSDCTWFSQTHQAAVILEIDLGSLLVLRFEAHTCESPKHIPPGLSTLELQIYK